MNVLIISNKGLIEREDLKLIGSSTKRDDETKIGMFGSGWKYALAWLVRNQVDVKIYRGLEEIVVGFDVIKHRENDVAVITVDGEQTSLTSEMGPQWTGWMAIREILSNAIDEGEESINTVFNGSKIPLDENRTTIVIPMIAELAKVMREYDKYFAFERKADCIDEDGNLYYLKDKPSSINVYRKGIRCSDWDYETLFDVNFREIAINESRITTYSQIRDKIRARITNGQLPMEILIKILKENNGNFIPPNCNANITSYCKELLNMKYKLTTAYMVQANMMNTSTIEFEVSDERTLMIPPKWYNGLMDMGLVEGLRGFLNNNSLPDDAVITSGEHDALINKYLGAFNLQDVKLIACTWQASSEVYYLDGEVYYRVDNTKDPHIFAMNIASAIPYAMGTSHFKARIRKYLNKGQEGEQT